MHCFELYPCRNTLCSHGFKHDLFADHSQLTAAVDCIGSRGILRQPADRFVPRRWACRSDSFVCIVGWQWTVSHTVRGLMFPYPVVSGEETVLVFWRLLSACYVVCVEACFLQTVCKCVVITCRIHVQT